MDILDGFDFNQVGTRIAVYENYEVKLEILLSDIKETKDSVTFNIGVGGSVVSKPAIEDGVVFFTSCDKNVYALDLESGEEIWRFSTQGALISAVIIHKDRLYTASFDGNVYALTKKGKLIWKFDAGDKLAAVPAIHEDRIYFGCRDGNIYAIDSDGKLVWKFPTNGPIGSSVIVYKDVIYASSFDYNLYALSLDGKLLWRFGTNNRLSGPVAGNGVICFGCFDCNIYAVDTGGKLAWKYTTNDAIPIGTYAEFFGDTLYIGSRDYNLYAVNNGKLVWKFPTKNMIFTRPLIEDGRVYFGSADSNLYAIDQETGKKLWSFKAGGPALIPNKVGDKILFGCHDCNLYCINTKREIIWKFHTSLDYPSMVEEPPDAEYSIAIPTSMDIKKGKREQKIKKVITNYGEFKSTYMDGDSRDYIGGEIEKDGVSATYKIKKNIYRK